MRKELISGVSIIKSSHYRESVLRVLVRGIRTPAEICGETGIRMNHISSVLRVLMENGLAVCLNPQAKRGRLYRTTELGEDVFQILEKGPVTKPLKEAK